MADGRKNNGGHSTKGRAGRKSKSEELKVKDSINDAIVKEFGGQDKFWLFIAGEARESTEHLKMLLNYLYGKPTETKNVAIKELPTINIVYETDESTKEDIIT